jgi:hypothetical protein
MSLPCPFLACSLFCLFFFAEHEVVVVFIRHTLMGKQLRGQGWQKGILLHREKAVKGKRKRSESRPRKTSP